jgi:hypothetical protein
VLEAMKDGVLFMRSPRASMLAVLRFVGSASVSEGWPAA